MRSHSLFDLIYDHQRLSARARAGQVLDGGQQALLVGLAQLLRGERADSRGRRVMPRVEVPGVVRVALGGAFHTTEVRNISGGGLAVRSRVTPPAGTCALVQADDPLRVVSYAFPAVVTWSNGAAIGLAFNGEPSRSDLRVTPRPRRAAVATAPTMPATAA